MYNSNLNILEKIFYIIHIFVILLQKPSKFLDQSWVWTALLLSTGTELLMVR